VILYFLFFTGAFTVIVVGMVWYSRFMFHKIYGEMRGEIDCITEGAVPAEWEERLVKRLGRCGSDQEKAAIVAKYEKFVRRRVMDCILFMKRTSLVESEAEREALLERLESFRREYPGKLI
jgi:hypothetical protein